MQLAHRQYSKNRRDWKRLSVAVTVAVGVYSDHRDQDSQNVEIHVSGVRQMGFLCTILPVQYSACI